MMSRRTVRRIDFVVSVGFAWLMMRLGAGYWAFLVFPYGLWNYWDGLTRGGRP